MKTAQIVLVWSHTTSMQKEMIVQFGGGIIGHIAQETTIKNSNNLGRCQDFGTLAKCGGLLLAQWHQKQLSTPRTVQTQAHVSCASGHGIASQVTTAENVVSNGHSFWSDNRQRALGNTATNGNSAFDLQGGCTSSGIECEAPPGAKELSTSEGGKDFCHRRWRACATAAE